MKTTIDDGGYAFPSPADEKAGWHSESGMTMRDWFAGRALAGLYACRDLQLAALHDFGQLNSGDFNACMARQAYQQADAMIAARKAGAA